jgi:hypothetical protein
MTDEAGQPILSGTGRLVEMLVIVASILLAFALDSWWDRQSEAADHEELAQLLHADFTEAREQLRRNIVRGDTLVAGAQALMAALDDPSAVEGDSIKVLFPYVMRPIETVPAPPSYRAAMSSGAITFIDDPGLFRALSAVDQAQGRMDTYSRLAADIHYVGALAGLESSIGSLVVLTSFGGPNRFVPADYIALVSRPEVYSASRLASQVSRNLLASLRIMESAMTSVLEQLESSGRLGR